MDYQPSSRSSFFPRYSYLSYGEAIRFMQLSGKRVFITGASRGIGKAIALRLAKEGAHIAIVAKSIQEDPRLGGTIYSAAREVQEAGGRSLAIPCDIRDEEQIIRAVQECYHIFGGIDILINNASAISLAGTQKLETRQLDLMLDINIRGTYLVTRYALPFLTEGKAQIINLSPPWPPRAVWLKDYPAYALSKYQMSMMVLAWAEEFKDKGIQVNALWPKTIIGTAAIRNLPQGESLAQKARSPEIMADATYHLITKTDPPYQGQLLLDEEILTEAGVTDFRRYSLNPDAELIPDLFVDIDPPNDPS